MVLLLLCLLWYPQSDLGAMESYNKYAPMFFFLYRIVLYGFTPYDADCVTLLCASLAAGLYAYAGYYVHGPENKNKIK